MDKEKIQITTKESPIISEVLDKVIKKIDNEQFSIQSDDQRSQLERQIFYQTVKIHSKLRSCVYPGCTQRSIRRSHSIQKNSVLKIISEGNHVYQPQVDMTHENPKMQMIKIGINKASTFPGFCQDHERLFEKFEHKGSIDKKEEALLQTFRAICREKVFRENEKEILIRQRNTYKKNLERLAKLYIIDELLRNNLAVETSQISFSSLDDSFIQYLGIKIDYLSKSLNELDEYISSYFRGTDNYVSYEMKIDYSFPVCIAGFGNQKYEFYGNERNFILFLNVIPYKDETVIICYSLNDHKDIFKSVIKYYSQNILTILNFIESFMVNSSDHWFVNPSFWDSLPGLKKDYILQCLLHSKDSFIKEIPFSIFDDIRKIFIDSFIESRNGVELTDVERTFLENEKLKLTKKIKLQPLDEIIKGMNENFNL